MTISHVHRSTQYHSHLYKGQCKTFSPVHKSTLGYSHMYTDQRKKIIICTQHGHSHLYTAQHEDILTCTQSNRRTFSPVVIPTQGDSQMYTDQHNDILASTQANVVRFSYLYIHQHSEILLPVLRAAFMRPLRKTSLSLAFMVKFLAPPVTEMSRFGFSMAQADVSRSSMVSILVSTSTRTYWNKVHILEQ